MKIPIRVAAPPLDNFGFPDSFRVQFPGCGINPLSRFRDELILRVAVSLPPRLSGVREFLARLLVLFPFSWRDFSCAFATLPGIFSISIPDSQVLFQKSPHFSYLELYPLRRDGNPALFTGVFSFILHFPPLPHTPEASH